MAYNDAEGNGEDPGLPGPLEDGDSLRGLTGPAQYETALTHWLPEHPYHEGFRRAAEVLSDHVRAQPADAGDLVMPIMYCYRHSIELRLKQLLLLDGLLTKEDVKPLAIHDLRRLWSSVRPILQRTLSARTSAQIGRAEIVLYELADLDCDGQRFRYDLTKGGEASLPSAVLLNMDIVRAVMPKLEEFLDDAASEIVTQMIQEQRWRKA
jgi:hypothetical protein